MDATNACHKLYKADLLELPQDIINASSILFICSRERLNAIRSQFPYKGKRFRSISFNTQVINGIYDVAILDGGDPKFDVDGLANQIYPYIKDNVKKFYIYG